MILSHKCYNISFNDHELANYIMITKYACTIITQLIQFIPPTPTPTEYILIFSPTLALSTPSFLTVIPIINIKGKPGKIK